MRYYKRQYLTIDFCGYLCSVSYPNKLYECSFKRVLELSYEDVKSAKNGLIVITPDFDNFTTKLIAADDYSKYLTETPILEGVANREYYGKSATSIENKSTIEYETEQGLPALIYGEQGLSSLPI